MFIDKAGLDTVFTAFNAAFMKGAGKSEKLYTSIAMVTKSVTDTEEYTWLGTIPAFREWIGARHVKGLSAHGFKIKNRLWETTLGIPRTTIEDDQYGLFAPMFEDMGRMAGEHADKMIFELLKAGFTSNSYDGQSFFDNDHPVLNSSGTETFVSNVQAGANPAWFLLDTSRAIKPLIYQERLPFELQRQDKSENEQVFTNDEYRYGVRARASAGYGLWQLAFGSKATLDAANYELARKSMMEMKGENDRPLNIVPDTLVVPPALEGAGRRLLNSALAAGGGTNEWAGSAKLIVTPLVA